MQSVLNWISNHLWTVIIAIPTLIQITPIKINPWSALAKWFGKFITGDACSKIDDMVSKVNNLTEKINKIDDLSEKIINLDKEVAENEKDRIRWEILNFANSCHNRGQHTKDEFEHIIALNTKYKRLLKETKDENGVFEIEYEYINKLYAELKDTNGFLK